MSELIMSHLYSACAIKGRLVWHQEILFCWRRARLLATYTVALQLAIGTISGTCMELLVMNGNGS